MCGYGLLMPVSGSYGENRYVHIYMLQGLQLCEMTTVNTKLLKLKGFSLFILFFHTMSKPRTLAGMRRKYVKY